MKSMIAMLLGALIGLSLLAWSLATLVPVEVRNARADVAEPIDSMID